MSDGHPWALLVRQVAGRVTAAEADELAAWRAQDPEHARLMQRLNLLVETSRAADVADHTSEAWQRLERRLTEKAPGTRVLHVRPSPPPPEMASPPISRSWGRRPVRWAMIAAAVMIVVAAGVGSWRSWVMAPPAVHEIVTRRGERIEFGLPDGSRVTLGPESRLRFSAAAFARHRDLMLDGEGYFVVAHDRAHPFVVRARGTAAQAVGTAFDVRAYREDAAVQVAVTEGRVLLRARADADGSGSLLDRNDIGLVDAAGRVAVRRGISPKQYLGWINGEILVERVPLSTVLRELGRAYDVTIVLADSQMGSVPVTATFRGGTAEEAARTVAELLDMRIRRDGARFLLDSKAAGR